MTRRRQFGNLRRLPSGRWQARYLTPDATYRPAPTTYATKTEANRFLALVQTEMARGTWVDPELGKVTLHDYAECWLTDRTNLRPGTQRLYSQLLKLHVLPMLGPHKLADVSSPLVRHWYAELVRAHPGRLTPSKSYRLLHAILATAVDDQLLPRNPCNVKGAAVERSPERPVATVGQVYALAAVVPDRYRVLVLMATFTGLRWGEMAALTRNRLDLDGGLVRVVASYDQDEKGRLHLGPPKTAAGVRTVAIPPHLLPELREHLAAYAEAGPDGHVFVGERGKPLVRQNFRQHWLKATAAVGVDMHFHDLRGTGNTLAAATGASTRELMARLGHSSTRAAMIYQHATAQRDLGIAKALSELVTSTQAAGRTKS